MWEEGGGCGSWREEGGGRRPWLLEGGDVRRDTDSANPPPVSLDLMVDILFSS